jgi:hypothetical protein
LQSMNMIAQRWKPTSILTLHQNQHSGEQRKYVLQPHSSQAGRSSHTFFNITRIQYAFQAQANLMVLSGDCAHIPKWATEKWGSQRVKFSEHWSPLLFWVHAEQYLIHHPAGLTLWMASLKSGLAQKHCPYCGSTEARSHQECDHGKPGDRTGSAAIWNFKAD